MAESIEFMGEEFTVADRIGVLPLMRFAKIAKRGVDSDSMAGLVAMYDLLEQCIAPHDWDRFCDHADAVRASGEELMTFVGRVMAMVSGRPTSRPSVSSDGSPTMSVSSADASASQVIADLEDRGRPDLALVVLQAQESKASA